MACSAGYEQDGKGVPNILPTLRGGREKAGKAAVHAWMLAREVDPKDHSVAAYWQRVKNSLFGGLQADIFEVRPFRELIVTVAAWQVEVH